MTYQTYAKKLTKLGFNVDPGFLASDIPSDLIADLYRLSLEELRGKYQPPPLAPLSPSQTVWLTSTEALKLLPASRLYAKCYAPYLIIRLIAPKNKIYRRDSLERLIDRIKHDDIPLLLSHQQGQTCPSTKHNPRQFLRRLTKKRSPIAKSENPHNFDLTLALPKPSSLAIKLSSGQPY